MSTHIKRYLTYIIENIIINCICGLIVFITTNNPQSTFKDIITNYILWVLILLAGIATLFLVKNEKKLHFNIEEMKMAAISKKNGYDAYVTKVSELIKREDFDKLEKLLDVGEKIDRYYGSEK